jgi:PKD repeat protein
VLVAGFAAAAPTPDAGGSRTVDEDFSATYTGTDPSGEAVTFGWVFDGAIVDGATVSFTFFTPGTHSASFWADDRIGSNVSDAITVTVNDLTAPTGSGTIPSSANEDISVAFSSSAITDNDPNFASTRRDFWTFTDGGAQNLSGTGASHTFATPGSYSITLTVMDSAGNKLTQGFTLSIVDTTAPTGSGSAPSSANEDSSVSFSSGSISDNDPNFASTRRDFWTFTDGGAQNLSGTSPSYTFNTPGTFAITLTVMDATGNKLTQSLSIAIKDTTAPTANAGASQTVNEDTLLSFSGANSTDNDPAFSTTGRYYWTFSDGATPRSFTGASASYTFATPGSYTITLLVLDAAGNFASSTFTATIKDVTAPTAVITGGSPQTFNEDSVKTLDGSSSADNDPNFGSTGNYTWTFTDGVARTLFGKSTTYTFGTPGNYTITLTVRDAGGNSATATSTFVVGDITAPTGTLSPPTSANEDASVTFSSAVITDNDPKFAATRRDYWTFTDGTAKNLSGSSASYTFNTPGSYSITLTVMDSAGNKFTNTFTIAIKDITAPTGSGFVQSSWPEDSATTFTSVNVTDNDPNFASTRRDYWTFTDGTAKNLSGTSAAYTFATPGTFAITLLTMDGAGNRLAASFTIVITDITPPTVVIAAANLSMSRQQFSNATHAGTPTDNVAVSTSGWSFLENATTFNLTGATLTRRWDFVGVYTMTFWARDAAGNVGATSTTLTVTADVTAPTVSVAGPSAGDDQNALAFTGTFSDNNPNCATVCTLNWLVDGTSVLTGSSSFTRLFTAGRHTVTFQVIDPAANTGSAVRNVDIDQLVFNDLTWNGVVGPLNWNMRVSNGATFLIRNSQISNSTLGLTVNITVTNGRFIMENSTLTSTSPTVGFRINATRAAAGQFVQLLFNSSTVGGLYDWIWVVNGVLAARDSTFTDPRLANGGVISGVDSSIYLTNMIVNATGIATSAGVRANFTSAFNLATPREVILQFVTMNATSTPLRVFGNATAGPVNVEVRDSSIRSNSALATVRGIDLQMLNTTQNLTVTIQRADVQDIRNGALYALHNLFNGTATYNVTESNFSGSISNNGTNLEFLSSSAVLDITFANVAVTRSGLAGIAFRFVNASPNLPATVPSLTRGSITLKSVSSWNNTQDGVIFFQQWMRLQLNVNILNSALTLNKRHGLNIDTEIGNNSRFTWLFSDSVSMFNAQHGVFYQTLIQRVNVSFEMVRSSFENNTLDGFNFTLTQGQTFDTATYGNFFLNMTNSKSNTNRIGVGVYDNTQYAQYNFSLNMVDSQTDFNLQHGVNVNMYMRQYYAFRGVNLAPYSNVFIDLLRSEASRNTINGIHIITYYCGYGTTDSLMPASCLFRVNLTQSHLDFNNGRGLLAYMQYSGYYGSGPLYINLMDHSSADNNGLSGIYEYRYYNYMYNVNNGRISETVFYLRNSSLSFNGRLNSAEGFGLNTYYYYDYYLYGRRYIDADNMSFVGNKNSGVRWYLYYIYYGSPTHTAKIVNSTFADNLGYGYDPYYYYTYQTGGVFEEIRSNTFLRNALGAIHEGLPQSAARYSTPYSIKIIGNTIDQSAAPAITTYVTYSYASPYYSGSNLVNISNNRITNITGAAILWSMDPPTTGGLSQVDFSGNYIANTQDTTVLFMPGSTQTTHFWNVADNTFVNTSASALLISIQNYGSGNTGALYFARNIFRDTAGTAFTLAQSNVALSNFAIRDSTFINQQTAIQLTGVQGIVDNVTFLGSIKEDIWLQNGALDIHNTPVNPDKLTTVGAAAFNVYFHLKIYVSWAGSLRPAVGAIVELADALGTVFLVASVSGGQGLPEVEPLSYTKSNQGILGRSPFRVQVSFFELAQVDSIDLPGDRVVTVLLRDNVPPAMVLASPTAGFATRDSTLTVEGAAYDSQSGFTFIPGDLIDAAQFVEVSTDNVNWQRVEVVVGSVSEIQFHLTLVDLTEAVRNVFVRAHDDAGNYFTRTVPVILDWSPPVVTVLSAVPAITSAPTIHLVAETEVGASVYVNGVVPPELLTRDDGKHVYFEMDVAVQEGPNTITVMAMDALRNQGRVILFVLADREAPYLVVTSPAQDELVNTNSVTVAGHATDRNGVAVAVNSVEAVLDAQGNFSVTIPLAGDLTRIEVVATDSAGNTQIVVRDVRFDDLSPWITIEAPLEGALVNSVETEVSGVVEQGATLTINGEQVDTPRGIFARRIVLAEGVNSVHIVAVDSAGNRLQIDRQVIVDTEKPVITLVGIADEALWNKSTILLQGTVTDEHGASLKVGDADVPVDAQNHFQATVSLLEGTNVVTLSATDAAGNVQLRQLRIVRDTTAPVVAPSIEGLVPDAGTYHTSDDTIAVTGIAEAGSIVEVCYANGQSEQACNVAPLAADGSFRTYVDLAPDANNHIEVKATDAAGNSANRAYTVEQATPVEVAAQTPWAAYGLFGLALAVLGMGGYFLAMSRRSKSRPEDLASLDKEPGYAPAARDFSTGAPLAAAPEVAPVQAPTHPPVVEEPVGPVEPLGVVDVPPAAAAAGKKVRPMRRKAALGDSEAGGLSDGGNSAEGEVKPGDAPTEIKKEGDL